ncbi:unnamed protein product [Caenorhabditis auriculariae]|uniref:Transposase n=1 Tax=Caenorhabditis auriculariae TaxID=2777116 RepID=A0A8S1HDK1_9PELO|nr:unnamed protein product [Caenorhabditis auriculariae]
MGRWIPHPLTDYDKDRRVYMNLSLLPLHGTHGWLDNLITGDKKWALQDVAKADLHAKKAMLLIWWSVRGVELWELLPKGSYNNANPYTDQLQKLRLGVQNRRENQAVFYFQHDNARPHIARSTKAELETYGWHVLPLPPYFPDLAPSDYHLFSHLQRALAGQKFDDEIQLRSWLNWFKAQSATFWRQGILALPEQWQQTIDAHAEYFYDLLLYSPAKNDEVETLRIVFWYIKEFSGQI